MKIRNKNLKLLKQSHIYSEDMEHDACGVGLVASTEGKKLEKWLNMEFKHSRQFGTEEQWMQTEKLEMVLVFILKYHLIFL